MDIICHKQLPFHKLLHVNICKKQAHTRLHMHRLAQRYTSDIFDIVVIVCVCFAYLSLCVCKQLSRLQNVHTIGEKEGGRDGERVDRENEREREEEPLGRNPLL